MIRIFAPAKLNLFLRVLGERPDGYHALETIFERINLGDWLTMQPSQEFSLTCDDPALAIDENNLIVKAARRLQSAAQTQEGAAIHLRKRIPVAAGLGGGSSDAAATLLALNELWGLGWDRERLLPLAAELGSDVPFFLTGATFAIGRGRGEKCEPVVSSATLTHLLVMPEIQISTREVYDGLRRLRASEFGIGLTATPPSITMVQHALSNGSLGELATGLWNDLEPEAIRRCPISALIQSRLHENGCSSTLVTGSGPVVFGLCHDLAHAQDLAAAMRPPPGSTWRLEIVQTLHADACQVMNLA